jgi:hypothetical protein
MATLLIVVGVAMFLGGIAWLHWMAIRDCAVPDMLLLFTGVSVITYTFARWDRTHRTVLATATGLLLMALGQWMK